MITKEEITKIVGETKIVKEFSHYTIREEEITNRYHYLEVDFIFKYPKERINKIILNLSIFKYPDHYYVWITRFWEGFFEVMSDQIYKNKNIKRKSTILRKVKELISA